MKITVDYQAGEPVVFVDIEKQDDICNPFRFFNPKEKLEAKLDYGPNKRDVYLELRRPKP